MDSLMAGDSERASFMAAPNSLIKCFKLSSSCKRPSRFQQICDHLIVRTSLEFGQFANYCSSVKMGTHGGKTETYFRRSHPLAPPAMARSNRYLSRNNRVNAGVPCFSVLS